MINIKKIVKNKCFISFMLSLLLGAFIIVPNIVINKGIFALTADFNIQQIPFNKMINDSIKNGSILWTWYNDLGSNFIGTFSFYNLFSPFNIIGYLFKSEWFEYLIGPIYILKYGVTGLTSYLFLKRYVKNKNYAVIGSLLYTFSGFQLTNMLFSHFHDVVAFFPLLLYSFDNLVYDNKKGRFALYISLAAFTNWFFFIGECVFLIIYFFVKVFTKEYKIDYKKFILIVLEAFIGIGLASLVLIPSALFTISNPRVSNNWDIFSMLKYPNIVNYLEILRSFIFPSEAMYPRAIITESNYFSIELYLPVVGSVLAISYFFKNKKNWASILMVILSIFMVVPILNSSFILFQNTYYARWFYIPTLIMSLMSIKCLDEKISLKSGIIVWSILVVMFFILFTIFSYRTIFEKSIYDNVYFIITIIVMIINILVLLIIKKKKEIFLIISIFVFVTIWGNYTIYYYKDKNIKTYDSYYEYLDIKKYISLDNNSRTNSSKTCPFNYSYMLENNNIKTFNSNINGSSFKFYNSLDIDRGILTDIDVSNKELNNYLSVKYIISCNKEDLREYGYELIDSNKNYDIYYNNDYKEFGFSKKKYISKESFSKLGKNDRIKMLNDHIVLDDNQIKKYKKLFNKNVKYLSNKFMFLENGFKSDITSNEDTLAIFTVPYDNGFKVTVNGKYAKIENVDNGFMAVKINKGKNKIRFSYRTPGLKLGIIISILSLMSLIVYMINNLILDKRRSKYE